MPETNQPSQLKDEGGVAPAAHCSDSAAVSLRWVLDKIRTRQREIRDIQDRFTAASALHDAEIMRIRYNELNALATEINHARYVIHNPNAGAQVAAQPKDPQP